jgi:hypothetical protein
MTGRSEPVSRVFEKRFDGPGYGEFLLRFTVVLELGPSSWRLPRLEIRAWHTKPREERDREHQSPNGDSLFIAQRHLISNTADLRAWFLRYTEAHLREELGVPLVESKRHPGRAFDRAVLELDDWIIAWAKEVGITNHLRT